MRKNKITTRLSLIAKFKGNDMVEVVIMNDKNQVQIELIPINFGQVSDKEADPILTELSDPDVEVEESEEGGNE